MVISSMKILFRYKKNKLFWILLALFSTIPVRHNVGGGKGAFPVSTYLNSVFNILIASQYFDALQYFAVLAAEYMNASA